MAVVQQLTLFEKPKTPAQPKASKARKRVTGPAALARGEFESVNPPNLAQDTALWLLGQRSIALQRGKRYVPASIKHPGKMQPDVAGAIIDTYTKPGDVLIDCMGGIGTTGVEGAERGRHMLCVELVRHWANVAYANAVRTAYRGAPGTMRVVQGDARALPGIVQHVADMALLSPPYGEALEPRAGRVDGRIERIQRLIEAGVLDPKGNSFAGKVARRGALVKSGNAEMATWDPRYDADAERHQVDAVVSSPVYGDSRLGPTPSGVVFGQDRAGPDVANLQRGYDAAVISPPYGEAMPENGGHVGGQWGANKAMQRMAGGYAKADAVVTSPPFGEGREPGKAPGPAEPRAGVWSEYENGAGPSPGWRGLESRTYSPTNNEGRQVDATLFSPPFGPTQTGRGLVLTGFDTDKRTPAEKGVGVRYDAMIASPAYGEIRQDGGDHQFGGNSAMDNYTGEARVKHRAARDPSNVGNKKYGTMKQGLAMVERLKRGETVPPEEWPKLTYLEDMALIYWGCLQVLKDGGLCILVLKDYRREKQRVDLVGDTITLMKAVGFTYHDRALAVTSALGTDTKIKSMRRVKRGPRWKLRLNYSTQIKVVVKVSPFVRLNARKPEKNGGAVMLPVGEEVLVYRKEAKKR